jgi:RimJ/RimL family protein N-acetyltransferase
MDRALLPLPLLTDRLCVRRLTDADLPAFVAFMTDPVATAYLSFDHYQRTRAGAEALAISVISSYDTDAPIHAYTVAERETDLYVGSVGYSPLDEAGRFCEIFYTVVSSRQRRGYARELVRAFVEALLRRSDVVEVHAYAAEANVASHRTAIAAGMRDCGLVVHPLHGAPGRLFVAERK